MLSNYYLMLNECFLGARGGPGGGGGCGRKPVGACLREEFLLG